MSLFGFTDAELFQIANRVPLPAWVMLGLFPRFRYTSHITFAVSIFQGTTVLHKSF